MSSLRPNRSNTRQGRLQAWKEFERDLETAVAKALPTKSAPYAKVAVLSMTWDNTDITVSTAENRLLNVLSKQYRFVCEKYSIPTRRPNSNVELTPNEIKNLVTVRVSKFRTAHDQDPIGDDKHLLIYYYSGHGHEGNGSDMIWFGSQTQQHLYFNWHDVAPIATASLIGDPLLLIDCCQSSMSAVGSKSEILASCCAEGTSSGNAARCFTTALCEELEKFNGEPRSVAEIHCLIANDLINKQVDESPVHVPHVDNRASIVLARTESKEVKSIRLKQDREVPNRVVISVSLSSGVMDVPSNDRWAHWLTTNLPPNVREVEIRTAFETASTLAIVLIPIPIWDYLPDRSAYNFVEHATGPLSNRPGVGGRRIQLATWSDTLAARPGPSNVPGGGGSSAGGKGGGGRGRGTENVKPGT